MVPGARGEPQMARHLGTRLGPSVQLVLSEQRRVSSRQAAAFTAKALEQIREYIVRNGIQVDGPPFVICHPSTGDQIGVEAGWPVTGQRISGAGSIHLAMLPPNLLRPSGRPGGPAAPSGRSGQRRHRTDSDVLRGR